MRRTSSGSHTLFFGFLNTSAVISISWVVDTHKKNDNVRCEFDRLSGRCSALQATYYSAHLFCGITLNLQIYPVPVISCHKTQNSTGAENASQLRRFACLVVGSLHACRKNVMHSLEHKVRLRFPSRPPPPAVVSAPRQQRL